MRNSKKGATATADLTDDLIIEILSRLPVKSVCRFKCVSRHWYCLISHPEHRKKLPQTLSGFFYTEYTLNNKGGLEMFPNFEGISDDQKPQFPDPLLAFLTGYRTIIPNNCCNGLVLCLCCKETPRDEADHVVCNPATEEWVVLPDSGYKTIACAYRLGFDPAFSPYFHVFQILDDVEDYGLNAGINIYSSQTGLWSHKENGWGDNKFVAVDTRSIFFNGTLYLLSYAFRILTVDTEGKTWGIISLLDTTYYSEGWLNPLAFIGHSQGRLYYINRRDSNISKLSVWILEDSNGTEWVLKYSINITQLFGKLFKEKDILFQQDYALIAIHPECNLIFFVWRSENILLSYDMDRGKICIISRLKDHLWDSAFPSCLPYVPSYARMGKPRAEA